MTKKKDFKRKVREHAARTGHSYASARRILLTRHGEHSPTTPANEEVSMFHRIEKSEFGFAIALPDGWSEFPRPFSDSPFEVARFACRDDVNHICIVYRMPGSRDPHLRGLAERSMDKLVRKGFGHFVLAEATVGGRSGLVLTFDKPADKDGVWAAREYFVAGRNLVYCLGLGSGDPARDAAVFDGIASRFEVAAMDG
jgi:hypothetical protein